VVVVLPATVVVWGPVDVVVVAKLSVEEKMVTVCRTSILSWWVDGN